MGTFLRGLFGPEPPIRVARETTFVTEPLAPDGLPDYKAAFLAHLGPAPPPEENAAAGLLQVVWPLGMDAADLPAVCMALGIPNVPPIDPLRQPPSGKTAEAMAACDAAELWPWTAEELPDLDLWIGEHDVAIDAVVAAMNRPRYWLPSPMLLQPESIPLLDLTIPDQNAAYVIRRILTIRAYRHLGAGRHAAAWRDIRALHRFGRSFRQSGGFSMILVLGNWVCQTADRATRHLLAMPDVPAEVVTEIGRDLDAVGPPTGNDLTGDRLCDVAMAVCVARRVPGGRWGRAAVARSMGWAGYIHTVRIISASSSAGFRWPSWEDVCPNLSCPGLPSLDWNVVLAEANAAHDAFEAAQRLPTAAARRAEHERLGRGRDRRRAPPTTIWAAARRGLLRAASRGVRSVAVGDHLPGLIESEFSIHVERPAALFVVTRTAAALAAWRADHGPDDSYPERLDDLVPRYLPAVPIDPFSDAPLVYERRAGGYLLASVGPNGIYDGGTREDGSIIGGEWQSRGSRTVHDDDVVRVPYPQRMPSAE